MCDPISIGLTVAAAAVQMGGQFVQGQAQATQASYEAQVAKQNAALSTEQAKDSIDQTKLEAQRRQREGAQLAGQQQAAMAANGVDLNFGSALDVQRDTQMYTNEDVQQIYRGGFEQQRGFLIDAANYRMSEKAAQAKGKAAKVGSYLAMAGTALGAASQINGMRKPPAGAH
jgi:hypothetical protein